MRVTPRSAVDPAERDVVWAQGLVAERSTHHPGAAGEDGAFIAEAFEQVDGLLDRAGLMDPRHAAGSAGRQPIRSRAAI